MSVDVSVVVPTYNRAYGLATCLGALMEQDYRSYEVILSDDGSTDDTRAVPARALYPWRKRGPRGGAQSRHSPSTGRNHRVHGR